MRLARGLAGDRSSSAYWMLARTQPAAPAANRTTKAGGKTRMAGSNSGSSECRSGVEHGPVKDAAYSSGVSLRDPDGIALEFFAPPG